jgi:hypothetical protein
VNMPGIARMASSVRGFPQVNLIFTSQQEPEIPWHPASAGGRIAGGRTAAPRGGPRGAA